MHKSRGDNVEEILRYFGEISSNGRGPLYYWSVVVLLSEMM